MHPADGGAGEGEDLGGDAGRVHQVAGHDEERHRDQREGVDPVDHIVQHNEARHARGRDEKERRDAERDSDGSAGDQQREEHDEHQGQFHDRAPLFGDFGKSVLLDVVEHGVRTLADLAHQPGRREQCHHGETGGHAPVEQALESRLRPSWSWSSGPVRPRSRPCSRRRDRRSAPSPQPATWRGPSVCSDRRIRGRYARPCG